MENTTATTAPSVPTIARLAPLVALALFIAYSLVVTASSGSLAAACSPMLIAAIGLLVWHDRVTEG